ncbi:C4-dicarboxylate ABC transporter substrate-binding protein [Vibrio cholerae]|nr:C4-dicarboxylate ABC transporter substrate-binding protein [Vibrio cholerae]
MIPLLYRSLPRIKPRFSGRKARSRADALGYITNEGREIHVIT